jgi:hypothetical protein
LGELGVEWLEPLGRAQQQSRRVTTPSQVKGDLSTPTLYLRLTKLVKRPRFCAREQ